MLRVLKAMYVWGAFTLGVVGTAGLAVQWASYSKDREQTQTHRFEQVSCQYSVDILGIWEATSARRNTYTLKSANPLSKPEHVALNFPAVRRGSRSDALPALFSEKDCSSRDVGEDVTTGGHRIRFQVVQCRQSASGNQALGEVSLYGTIPGYWIALGAALHAPTEDELNKYRPRLTSILRSFKHQCAFEFTEPPPLPTTPEEIAQADAAATASQEEAVRKAAAIAGSAMAAAAEKKP
jgi:hypothetical protein